MGESVDVFISYAPADSEFCEQVIAHLALLQRQGVIRTWYDKKIVPGEVRDDVIAARIETARVVLLLISASFLASDDCYRLEMERALVRHTRGEACVIPVIIRACDWKDAPFAHLGALPRGAQAVTSWRNADEAWVSVVSGIRVAVTEFSSFGKRIQTHDHEGTKLYHNTDIAGAIPLSPTATNHKFSGLATALAGACIAGALVTILSAISGEPSQSDPYEPTEETIIPPSEVDGEAASMAPDGGFRDGANDAESTEADSEALDGGFRDGANDVESTEMVANPANPETTKNQLSGIIFIGNHNLPAHNAEVWLLGTPCRATTNEGGYFNFFSCSTEQIGRIRSREIYILTEDGLRCSGIPLLPPPAVTSIWIRASAQRGICNLVRRPMWHRKYVVNKQSIPENFR
ncbi:toll/interleukin-1 receptor domain-containing protein [Sorangium sp. So ce131]|uniref:toll/interleukin-1 receptor domain-containing protein n=1 Tax=Sorangium sp. So ce131 TaxID=3133282 RepID=UPI003F6370D3